MENKSAAKHTPGPQRTAMQALAAHGFSVSDVWLSASYFDGIAARKRIGDHKIEIWTGNADDGGFSDLHYAPVVYVDGTEIASGVASVSKAERIADIRASMLRAAIAKAEGK